MKREYVIRVFIMVTSEHRERAGKYMDLALPDLSVDEWLSHEADIGFHLDSLNDIGRTDISTCSMA